jgi:uncharacterized membrane protein
VAEAALLGTAAGMRSTVPLAALSLVLRRMRGRRVPIALAVVGELLYDKLPQAASRTAPPVLLARVVVGAVSGGIVRRALGSTAPIGAATGALSALVASLVFHRLRVESARRVSPLAAGFAEDVLAIATAASAVRRR